MARFFTADLHFGHSGIIKYCNRPWPTAHAMGEGLIDRWNEMVRPYDDVYILGDFCMCGAGYIQRIIPLLTGRKHLIMGNHDSYPARRWLGWGFASAIKGNVGMELYDGTKVILSHYPYKGDSGPVDRYPERRPIDEGQWLLHGHVHDRWCRRGKMINVGVDVWDWYPVWEGDIISMMRRNP
jgi:calcineurin-like phosphoesterase family protein